MLGADPLPSCSWAAGSVQKALVRVPAKVTLRKNQRRLSRVGTLTGCGDEYERRRDPLTDASSFVGSEKERPVFDDGPAKCSPKLV